MARAHHSDILVDAAGNIIIAAVGTLYTDAATSVLVDDNYTAASGGSLTSTVTTDSGGRWKVWFTEPKSYWIEWDNAGGTARYKSGALLGSFSQVSQEHQAFQSPADEAAEDASTETGLWIDARDYGFGVAGVTPAANRTALLAALDAAKYDTVAGRRVVVIPSTDVAGGITSGHTISSGIDLSSNEYTGVSIMAFGGWNDIQHALPPTVRIVSESGPVFYGTTFSHMTFQGLELCAPAGSPAWESDDTFRLNFVDMSARATGAAPAWKFTNAFWNEFTRGVSICAAGQHTFEFYSEGSVEPICGQQYWDNHVFHVGGILMHEKSATGNEFHNISLNNCTAENWASTVSWVTTDSSAPATGIALTNLSFTTCELADAAVGANYLFVANTCDVKWVNFTNCAGTNTAYWTVEAGGPRGNTYGIFGHGGSGSHFVGSDPPYDALVHSATVNFGGFDVRGDAGPTGEAATSGQGVRFFQDAESSARVAIDTFGLSFGGGAGAFDTNLYRSASDTLKTDDKLHVVGELELDGALNHDGSTAGFFATTPAAQPAGTTDVLASLVTLGLRAASSNPPLDLGTGLLTSGSALIGLAKIENNSTLFTLRHNSTNITTGYALQQDGTANTYLNAITTLRHRVANTDVVTLTASLVTVFQPVLFANSADLQLGTGAGSKIGTATGQKLGFWGATPVVQQVLATGAGATVDNVITMLQTLGLCKQS